jgi:Protein of unknown function (DUF3455)
MKTLSLSCCLFAVIVMSGPVASAELPETVATTGEALVTVVHAHGAQIYECKADTTGKLVWQFREPIATLVVDGKTVGRHYAGPSWEMNDGSAVVGKVTGKSPGASPKDVALLKLAVTSQRGNGQLTGVTTVQRLNTSGGVAQGPCDTAGALESVSYSADYAFHRKSRNSFLQPELQTEEWKIEETF